MRCAPPHSSMMSGPYREAIASEAAGTPLATLSSSSPEGSPISDSTALRKIEIAAHRLERQRPSARIECAIVDRADQAGDLLRRQWLPHHALPRMGKAFAEDSGPREGAEAIMITRPPWIS